MARWLAGKRPNRLLGGRLSPDLFGVSGGENSRRDRKGREESNATGGAVEGVRIAEIRWSKGGGRQRRSSFS